LWGDIACSGGSSSGGGGGGGKAFSEQHEQSFIFSNLEPKYNRNP
jgi:hypothetical protein